MSGEDYELVMPFVVCKSKGGPFDDDAFVSGWRLATISASVEPSGAEWSGMVQEQELPQVELVAMRRGLTVTKSEVGPGSWLVVALRHGDGDPV